MAGKIVILLAQPLKTHGMKLSLKQMLGVAVVGVMTGCSAAKPAVDKTLLSGEWITITPENSPNVTIGNNNTLYLVMTSDEQPNDTLRFSYSLKKRRLKLYMDKKEVSASEIQKLTNDSLIYKRERDDEIFSYRRKAK